MAKPNMIMMRPDFDPQYEIIDTVEEVEWFMDSDGQLYECNGIYNDMIIKYTYTHPESGCAWMICELDNGSIWQFGFDMYTEAGVTKYKHIRDSTELSGGHLW